MMVDPTNITKYDQSTSELQEVLLWWVCAAGKNGVRAAKSLESLLSKWRKQEEPFAIILEIARQTVLSKEMQSHGIGCYNLKAKTFLALALSNLDLHTCTVEDLEKIPGIGPKTARCFIIHSRPNQQYAGLDVHLKKFLRDLGYEVPQVLTIKKYREMEEVFLALCQRVKMTVSQLDLMIWNAYSKNVGTPQDILSLFARSA